MTKSSLLLDADVVIGLHEMGYWKGALANYSVCAGATVVSEVEYYKDSDGNKISINLQEHIDKKEITELSASAEQVSDILCKLRAVKLDGLDPGELESVAIMESGSVPDLNFCLIDTVAAKAMTFLKLDDKMICVEEMLRNCGMLQKSKILPLKYTKKRLQNIITDGKLLTIKTNK
jgi:hypothetical protein